MENMDPGGGTAYFYLNAAEVRFIDAAVARLIPGNEKSPGAKEANVTRFIDRQLSSVWGAHGRCYRMGPWLEGTPQQGYQSRLTPQEVYRAAIREIDLYCSRTFGKIFHFLDVNQQDTLLHALEDNEIELESTSSRLFFSLLLRNTNEGFFSDPMYGGNKDKVGWKLIGFPGVASASYPEHMDKYNVPYRVEPVSILDIMENKTRVDAQGYPVHVIRNDANALKDTDR